MWPAKKPRKARALIIFSIRLKKQALVWLARTFADGPKVGLPQEKWKMFSLRWVREEQDGYLGVYIRLHLQGRAGIALTMTKARDWEAVPISQN